MRFYNTLTRSRDEFTPLDGNTVRIYSCGPTVYSYAHIGNLRTYIFMDLLRRSLRYNGYKLKHVMNITDVGHLTDDADDGEDKMEKASREQKKTPWEIADYYTKVFLEDTAALNIGKPEIIVKATDHIPEMIAFVEGLCEKGYGYETSDGIYYDIGRFPEYGRLSRLKLDELKSGARVEINDEKRHPADFAIWKKAPKEHIMQWESPWGMGYPGWHIECSAMGLKYLGEQFDIHTGGVDHIPIHHENEIAQSEGLCGCIPAVFWMHGEFMLVDGGKMSKSLGNTYTLAQLAERGYSPGDFRYFCLNAHYRQKLNFTFEGMDSAKKSLENLRKAIVSHKGVENPEVGKPNPEGGEPKTEGAELVAGFKAEFDEAVSDDLNIPKALGVVWSAARSEIKSKAIYDFIQDCDAVLGLNLDKLPAAEDEAPAAGVDPAFDAEIRAAIEARAAAKKAKNYAEADRIRDMLAEKGVTLTDTKEGTVYKIG
jgi:cysteinyl-tRNA synthetase